MPKESAVLQMQFMEANASAQIFGEELLPSVSNYFRGSDPDDWQAEIPNYGKVKYQDLYPGVDLVFYGIDSGLKYDFIVNPGKDPGIIKLNFNGSEDTYIKENGDLVLLVNGTEIVHQAPYIYQEIGGSKVNVPGKYQLNNGVVTFQVGDYNPEWPLVIDPVIEYSTYLGGSGYDQGTGVALDKDNNVFITGKTSSVEFPLTNAYDGELTQEGYYDVFVTKFDTQGDLIFSTYLGPSGLRVPDIAVDPEGNVYVAGVAAAGFPITTGVVDEKREHIEAFVTKLSADGGTLVYSTYLGGNNQDEIHDITVNADGNAYVAGYTFSTDFPVSDPAYQKTKSSWDTTRADGFLAKINSAGTQLDYATYFRGTNVHGIAVDGSGNAYITGDADSNLPLVGDPYQASYGGSGDVFLTKFDSTGIPAYSTFLGEVKRSGPGTLR